jgi:hypothetical protein
MRRLTIAARLVAVLLVGSTCAYWSVRPPNTVTSSKTPVYFIGIYW